MPVHAFQTAGDVPAGFWRWPNFAPTELACKGSGALVVSPAALDGLQAARSAIGRPFYVTSGYRSPQYNRTVGGSPRSQHMAGCAFDILLTGLDREALKAALVEAGAVGIGDYDTFVHADWRDGPPARWDFR